MKEIIKAEIERQIKANTDSRGVSTGTPYIDGYRLLTFLDSLQDTDAPVFPSEQEVKKASEQYADGMWLSGNSMADSARKTFTAGANWMKYHID